MGARGSTFLWIATFYALGAESAPGGSERVRAVRKVKLHRRHGSCHVGHVSIGEVPETVTAAVIFDTGSRSLILSSRLCHKASKVIPSLSCGDEDGNNGIVDDNGDNDITDDNNLEDKEDDGQDVNDGPHPTESSVSFVSGLKVRIHTVAERIQISVEGEDGTSLQWMARVRVATQGSSSVFSSTFDGIVGLARDAEATQAISEGLGYQAMTFALGRGGDTTPVLALHSTAVAPIEAQQAGWSSIPWMRTLPFPKPSAQLWAVHLNRINVVRRLNQNACANTNEDHTCHYPNGGSPTEEKVECARCLCGGDEGGEANEEDEEAEAGEAGMVPVRMCERAVFDTGSPMIGVPTSQLPHLLEALVASTIHDKREFSIDAYGVKIDERLCNVIDLIDTLPAIEFDLHGPGRNSEEEGRDSLAYQLLPRDYVLFDAFGHGCSLSFRPIEAPFWILGEVFTAGRTLTFDMHDFQLRLSYQ